MAQSSELELVKISRGQNRKSVGFGGLIKIRVSPNSYFVTFFLSCFSIGFLTFLELDIFALMLFIVSWTTIPLLAWKDRIVFDGRTIFRTGILPRIWSKLVNKPVSIELQQIQQIDTEAIRALKRGGSVFYRYRTSVHGNGIRLSFASGGEDYRNMVGGLFSYVEDDVLDNRSLEIRDYLQDPKETLTKAEFARIPSVDVLEATTDELHGGKREPRREVSIDAPGDGEIEKAEYLRVLANELRLSGNLLRALEVFRRSLRLTPDNPQLIFEYARCLHSYAGVERDSRLLKRANAALRLAEIKSPRDAGLLARIGESYFQYGDWNRARRTFHKSLAVLPENFRALRGLAEVALREGKIAHVIHHFANAAHSAGTEALRLWSIGENEYFRRLNLDQNYMEAEITRIGWLDQIEMKKRLSLKIALVGLLAVLIGVLFSESVALGGWFVSIIAISVWLILVLSQSLLAERSRFPLKQDED